MRLTLVVRQVLWRSLTFRREDMGSSFSTSIFSGFRSAAGITGVFLVSNDIDATMLRQNYNVPSPLHDLLPQPHPHTRLRNLHI